MSSNPEASHVSVETRGAVRVIRFNRPEKKNALTAAMYSAAAHALHEADADDAVRVAVLAGAGENFTAGNDLGEFLASPPVGQDSPVFRYLVTLNRFTKPLLAAVDGVAVGIGVTMLLHCDLVYASNRARFQMPFTSLALVPEGASSVLLPQRVGLQRASEWLLFGEAFDAAAAHSAGLVNTVLAPEALLDHALARAEALASKPVGALRASKELIRGPLRPVVAEALAREGAVFTERLQSAEAREVFNAFVNRKR